MKANNTMTRRVAALLLAVLLLLGMTLSASAATYEAGDNIRVYHDFALAFKLKERNADGFPWMATGYLVVSGNTLVLPSGASWVYCIDYWRSASGGTYTSTDLMQTPAWTSLSFVARKGITHAMIYGCPNNGRADIYSYAATQLIIWEYQLGQRTNASQTVSYFNSTLSQNSTLRSIYDSILSSMAAHDILPSFDGQSVTLNGYGRENGVTLTDTNGKLMNDAWTVSVGAGFHAEQTGNSLLIYADSSVTPGSTTNITLKRILNVVTGTALGIAVGQQKAIIGVPPDPVAAALSVTLNNMGELTIQKTSDSGDVSGYCFKVYKHTDNLSWYGKSDSSGNVYVTNSSYTASGTKVYTFTGMTDGTYSFLEVLSQKGKDLVFPDSWRITVVKDGSTKFDHTYTASNLSKDSNGDCRLASVAITGLTGGGTMTMTIHNAPESGDLEVVKTSSDGNISGISFTVEEYEPEGGIGWWEKGTYTTDTDGKINIPNLSVGSRLRITENIPENYVCLSENPQEITLVGGTNTVSFENKPIIRLELLKTSDDGKVDGIEFTLSILRGRRYVDIGTYTTHDGGQISVEDLTLGATYRLAETVPEGYIGVEPVQNFVAAMGTNTVNFENRLIRGSLRIVKKDKGTETPLQGAGYRVYSSAGKLIAEGYTDEHGELVFENLRYGSYYYQEFEAPEGFALDDTCYNFSITQDGVEVSKLQFNDVKEGSIRISKTNEQGRPLSGVTFLLEFSVNGGETWSPVAHRDESEPVRPGYCTSNGLDAGKLSTGIKGQAVFTGLCIDTQLGEVLYRVTEVSTVSGYSLLADYAFEGSLSEDEEIDVSFTVVNQPEFQLPATGGEGFTSMIIGLIVVLVVGVIAVIIIRVKEKKDDDDR